MNLNERKMRVIARGEATGHCHVVIGGNLKEKNDKIILTVEENEVAIQRHLLEKNWLESEEQVWTKEHEDFEMVPDIYEYVPQIEFSPYDDKISEMKD